MLLLLGGGIGKMGKEGMQKVKGCMEHNLGEDQEVHMK